MEIDAPGYIRCFYLTLPTESNMYKPRLMMAHFNFISNLQVAVLDARKFTNNHAKGTILNS